MAKRTKKNFFLEGKQIFFDYIKMLSDSSSATAKNDMPTVEVTGDVSTTPPLPTRQYALVKPAWTTPLTSLTPPRLCRQRGQNCLLSEVAKDLCD